jgi:hypothetical protein
MSDLRVALVAEGPTDGVVIEAALKALLPRPFVLTQLQPESTRPKIGTGWGGVLRWCADFATRRHARLEDDPTLTGFDLFVIHADADIAEAAYPDVSEEVADLAKEQGWPVLPSQLPCPPASGSADTVRGCLRAWTGLHAPGPKTILCVPSKAVDAWLAAACLNDGHPLLTNVECNRNVEATLANLPMATRIKKTMREYRAKQPQIASSWARVRTRCTQAERFSLDVGRALQPDTQ